MMLVCGCWLLVQAMVDELYFNINAESDILALAFYDPFSLRWGGVRQRTACGCHACRE